MGTCGNATSQRADSHTRAPTGFSAITTGTWAASGASAVDRRCRAARGAVLVMSAAHDSPIRDHPDDPARRGARARVRVGADDVGRSRAPGAGVHDVDP